METIKRTPLTENINYGTKAMTQRANRSACQWLFNPYSVADTTNWAVTTGVGKLSIGGLTKVTNVTETVTPNRGKKDNRGVNYDSTFDFDGYQERERFALNIANEIVNNYPRRVHRILALEGIEDNAQVEQIVAVLLGEGMAVAKIEGESDPVPVLPQMLEVLRHNMREIAKTNSPQKALLLMVGKEFESTIADNIKLAVEDLKLPEQDVASKKRAGFDTNAKRNFLALGKEVPEVNLTTSNAQASAQQAQINERMLGALDKLNSLMGGDAETEGNVDETTIKDSDLPPGFITTTEGNQIVATTTGSAVEMEFEDQPKIVETKPVTEKQMEKAVKAETEKGEQASAEEARRETEGVAQCAAIKSNGEQCKNDALEGSRFCAIKAHKEQGK